MKKKITKLGLGIEGGFDLNDRIQLEKNI